MGHGGELPSASVVFFLYFGLHPERCILVIMVTVSLGGHMVLENPGSSLIWLHDRFQWMLETLASLGIKVP